jgi:polyisoprenoid-binding protein YceI
MKLLPIGIASAFLFTAAGNMAHASEWEIDPSHTTAQFTVRHMMVTDVKGQFGKVAGTVNLDDKDPTKSKVDVVIDVSTIDTREPKRDGHLKSADFFDVANHPHITFKSTKIVKAGKGKFKVTGDLTMRGVTKSVVLDVSGPTDPVKNLMGKMVRGAEITGKINRKDWGLTWNKPLEAAGGVLVGDDVKIDIGAELVEKTSAPAAAPPAPATTGTEAKPKK